MSAPRKNTGEAIEIIARGVMIRRGAVLLCRNSKHGYCYLPGGHIEFSESAAGALAREFLEEAGIRVRVGLLAMVTEGVFRTSKRAHHEINLVFHVEHEAANNRESPVVSREAGIEFCWTDLAAIPDTDIRPLSAKAFLAAGAGGGAGGGFGSQSTASLAEWVSEVG